ncbi:MAG: PilZ domain-containing protein [Spirochaetales bacterium]|nr:PilZ domain-containing protein [Spirochaetales bacterium]
MVPMILLFVLLLIVITLIFLLRRAGGGSFPWVHFYAKGKEAGFSFNEVNLLRKVAVEGRLKNPTSLFWSIKQLDRSLRGTIIRFKSEGVLNEINNMEFLSKLFNFRKTVELKLPKYVIGLKTTRKITKMQYLKISIPGLGVYVSQVVENQRRYVAITYPEGPKLPQGYEFKGEKLHIYFWRKDDAGYVFESRVVEDHMDRKVPILYISHSDSIIRSQKRSSVRADLNHPAELFPLKVIAQASDDLEDRRGIRCRLQDISEDGAALLIGGRGKVGMNVKIQFMLSDSRLVMCGVVKGVSFQQNKNTSIIHIQSVPLSNRIKTRILAYVYNLFGERSSKNIKDASGVLEGW